MCVCVYLCDMCVCVSIHVCMCLCVHVCVCVFAIYNMTGDIIIVSYY